MYLITQSASRTLLILGIISATFFIVGCSSSKNIVDKKGEDFDQFYDQFHTDVNFQSSRIVFPLKGAMEDNSGRTSWTKENWIPLKVKIQDVDSSKYKVEYEKMGNRFIQKFSLPGSGFSSEYHFEKIEGRWYLVFAEDINL